MTSEWNHSTINDVCVLVTDGSHSSPKSVNDGKYMVSVKDFTDYGFDFASCRMISNDDYETLKRNGCVPQMDDILIGKDGARFFEDIIIYRQKEKPALLSSIAILRCDKSKILPDFLYYVLRTPSFRQDVKDNYGSGSAIPRIILKDFKRMMVSYPSLEKQQSIISVLTAIDSKIQANTEINDNLEQQAAALFESWFVNYDPWDGVQPSEWENAPLGSFVEIKRGGSPRPIQDFLSDSGLRWLKISDVTSLSSPFVLEIKEHIKEEGLRKTVFLHAGELVLSNSATPGIPKILDVDTCIHDGWLYFPKSELSKYYLYLFFKHIRKELVALGNGSVFTNLKTDILKAFPATKADEATLKEFDALVTPLFDAMLNADRENFKLAAMRDALLPKLMSSEIDVSEVEL